MIGARMRVILIKGSAVLLLIAIGTSAFGREKCTSMCHLFDAWAMSRLCPNLTLIHTPDKDADYRAYLDPQSGGMRQLMNDALRRVRQDLVIDPKAACHPRRTAEKGYVECSGTDDDEGTVCQYVRERGSK
jgi:hypothetical protein